MLTILGGSHPLAAVSFRIPGIHGVHSASLARIMSGSGAVQLFILDTLSWMSAIVMVLVLVLGDCCGLLLDPLAIEHCCYVMPLSPICLSSTVQSQPSVVYSKQSQSVEVMISPP